MIRTPLRPLARILSARAKGENPDVIERENIRRRHEEMQKRARARAEGRLLVLGLFFFCAFLVVGGRMGLLATSEAKEPGRRMVATPPSRHNARISWIVMAEFWRRISRHTLFMHNRRF